MEFNFDEDIFDINCKTLIVKEKQYCPKKCTSEWFVNYAPNKKPMVDDYHLIMFEADLLYYKRDYKGALEKYFDRMKYFTVKNNALICATLGSIIRCYLKLNQTDLAEIYIPQMLNGSLNPGDCSSYELAYQVYKNNGKYLESLSYLVQALDINPRSALYWIYLYELLQFIKIDLEKSEICVNGEEIVITYKLFQDVMQYAKFSLNENSDVEEFSSQSKAILQKIKNHDLSMEHIKSLRFRYNTLLDLCSRGERLEGEKFFQKWFFWN